MRGPADVDALLRALRAMPPDAARTLIARSSPAFAARVLAPLVDAERGDDRALELALEESLAEAKAAIGARLLSIRIGATLSSFLGFVGAALALTWIQSGDHGLLGLDPSRVAGLGMSRAALSIALGVGGSSFALGSWMTLRRHAARLRADCDRAVDRARPAPVRATVDSAVGAVIDSAGRDSSTGTSGAAGGPNVAGDPGVPGSSEPARRGRDDA